jgi:hypothetical protein
MDTSTNSKKTRRRHLPTRDLEPRNGRPVTGGKKAVSDVKIVQPQTEMLLQELQAPTQS